jgi:predicted RNA-binding Zn ribbon-like protein
MDQPGDRRPAPGSLAVVQDFINTADLEGGTDALRDPGDLRSFWRRHGGQQAEIGILTDEDLALCRELREALRAACRAHVGVTMAAKPDELLVHGPLVMTFSPAGDARLSPAPGLSGAPWVIATLAAAVAEAVSAATWPRLKACESDPCQWVYYDHSPAGRSRWCTMSICGRSIGMKRILAPARRRRRSTGGSHA